MIVTENDVSDALDYLNIDPHPVALARKDVTDSENRSEQAYSAAFLLAEGSVAVKEAIATVDATYIEAKRIEAKDILELERHKAKVKSAEMLISVWQSEGANARAAERIR